MIDPAVKLNPDVALNQEVQTLLGYAAVELPAAQQDDYRRARQNMLAKARVLKPQLEDEGLEYRLLVGRESHYPVLAGAGRGLLPEVAQVVPRRDRVVGCADPAVPRHGRGDDVYHQTARRGCAGNHH